MVEMTATVIFSLKLFFWSMFWINAVYELAFYSVTANEAASQCSSGGHSNILREFEEKPIACPLY